MFQQAAITRYHTQNTNTFFRPYNFDYDEGISDKIEKMDIKREKAVQYTQFWNDDGCKIFN
jgi:hypothetical protein